MPKKVECPLLFSLGGDYVVENLTPVDAVIAMEKLGELDRAIRDVPDGSQVTITGWIA